MALFVALIATPAAVCEEFDQSFARYFPKSVLFYAETKDIRASVERGRELALVKFLSQPELHKFILAIASKRRVDATKDLDEITRALSLLEPVWQFADHGFSGKVLFALPDEVDELGRGQMILAAQLKEGRESYVREFLTYLPVIIRELTKNIGPRRALLIFTEDETIGGHNVTFLKRHRDAPHSESFAYMIVDGYLVLTFGRKTIENFIANYADKTQENLITNADFVRCRKSVEWTEAFWYMDAKRVINRMNNLFVETGVEIPAAVRGLSLLGLETCAGGITFRRQMVYDEIVSYFDEEREQVSLKFMEGTRCHFSAVQLLPEKPVMYYTFPFPVRRIYESLDKSNPKLFKRMEDVEKKMGISIKDDLLTKFSDEIEFYITMQGFLPESLFSMRIKGDPQNMELFLKAVSVLYPNNLVASEYEDRTLYLVKDADITTFLFAQAMAVHDGKLLIGSIPAIHDAIDGRERSLADNPAFNTLKMRITDEKTNGFFFFDTGELLVILKNYFFNPIAGALGGIDRNAVPPDAVFTNEAMPLAGSVSVTKNSMKIQTAGLFNASTLFAMAGVRLVRKNLGSFAEAAQKRRVMRQPEPRRAEDDNQNKEDGDNGDIKEKEPENNHEIAPPPDEGGEKK